MRQFIYFLVIVSAILFPAPLSAQSCTCSVMLEELIDEVEETYIGFHLEVADEKMKEYENHIQSIRKKTERMEKTDYECVRLLQQYLNFFDDGHLFIYDRADYGEESLRYYKGKRKEKQVYFNSESEIKITGYETDIRGKWTDGNSEYVIIKKGKDYLAYSIEADNSEINSPQFKASLKKTNTGYEGVFYLDNHAPKYVFGNSYKEGTLLRLSGGIIWARLESGFEREALSHNMEDPHMPTLRELDDETILFTIPSFLTDRQSYINFLISNKDALFNTKYLIIDVRGNTGGNALYTAFMSLFADRKSEDRQGLVLASDATLEYFSSLAERNPEMYSPVADRIKENMGEIVDGPRYPGREIPPDSTNIEKVGIIADRGSMSASESFILSAKAISSKVTTFGEPTGGVIDYTNVDMIPFGCSDSGLLFGYPTTTLSAAILEKSFNKEGITPDVILDESHTDKVFAVWEYLKSL